MLGADVEVRDDGDQRMIEIDPHWQVIEINPRLLLQPTTINASVLWFLSSSEIFTTD